jgi:ribosomal protein L40E
MKIKPVKEKFVCIDCGCEASAMEALRCRSCFRKNVKTKIEWPSVEVIIEKLKSIPMIQLALELGVSDNAIRKFLKRNNESKRFS